VGKKDHRKLAAKSAPKTRPKAKVNGRSAVHRSAHASSSSKKTVARAPGKKPAAKKPAAKPAKRAPFVLSSIVLPEGYRPSEDEPFMNARHRAYFRNKLVAWKEEIVRQNRETLQVLHEDSAQHADLADRATSETDRALELRARDRQRKLIAKIDAALARLEEGTYGYCEETGDPIGLKRLDARPIATLSLEAQERHERREKVFRED
jgi:DnaK suppressor protein